MSGEGTRLQAIAPDASISDAVSGNVVQQRAERERSIARLWLLASHAKFLAYITAGGMLAGLAIAYLIPPRYESTTRLMPPDSQSGSSAAMLSALARGAGSGLASLGGDALGLKSTGVLFVGMLESRTVEDDVVEKFGLKRLYGAQREEDAQRELERVTEISEDHKSGIITIRVTDTNPERARGMASEYSEELNRLVNQLSTSAARREREFLEERLKGVQQDLQEAEKQFSQFASKNAAIDIKEQSRAMVDAAATLQGQLMAAESSLQGMKQVYTNQNVRVRSLEARIAELRNQLQKMGGKPESTPAEEMAASDALYPTLRKLPLLGVTYADLYRRTKVQESVFESLTQEYELAKVEEAKETPSVKVLDPANLPERRSFPPRMLLTVFGIFVGLGCGVGWVFGNAAWQAMDAQDPRKIFGQQVRAAARVRFPRRSGSEQTGNRAGILGGFERDPGAREKAN